MGTDNIPIFQRAHTCNTQRRTTEHTCHSRDIQWWIIVESWSEDVLLYASQCCQSRRVGILERTYTGCFFTNWTGWKELKGVDSLGLVSVCVREGERRERWGESYGIAHNEIIKRGYWRVAISYARTSKEVISSMSKAQISGYCKRLWEVHHSLRTTILQFLWVLYTIHIVHIWHVIRKQWSSYHSQEHTLHPQTEDSCNNPVALPHRARHCQ